MRFLVETHSRQLNAMKFSELFAFSMLSIFTVCAGISRQSAAQLTSEVEIELHSAAWLRNDNSRLNPENSIQDLDAGEAFIEAHLSVSDEFNDAQTMRWLLKTYGLYATLTDSSGNRKNVTRIDEAFIDWKGGDWFVNIGKRRVNWGHAMAFNPVNVIVPPRDPRNPEQTTEGQPVLWGSYGWNSGSLNLYYTRDFDQNWESDLNRWGARLNIVEGEFDGSFYYFDGEPYRDGRDYERLFGVSFSANLLAGATLYAEAAGTRHNYRNYYDANGLAAQHDHVTVQAVIGSYILIDPESVLSFWNGDANVIVEAYYNGSGYSEKERKQYFEALARAFQRGDSTVLEDYELTGMNQFYALATYRNSFKERYAFELTGLLAQDWSVSAQAQIEYALSDYIKLTAITRHNQGSDDSEFGNAPIANTIECQLEINF
ncbi:hypothetical protein U14_02350 [Candidatus Moduliflexus flocculans]|uniref:Phosphate-selective porin O and P n=1 Tax=Candidatus Moduliflexus flocculans TaxID=1499966 RepID=A0A0S6VXP8_9BACT|nr:hypothetical protein U14_02350 [Candidatus Moduliflexus flocculans]